MGSRGRNGGGLRGAGLEGPVTWDDLQVKVSTVWDHLDEHLQEARPDEGIIHRYLDEIRGVYVNWFREVPPSSGDPKKEQAAVKVWRGIRALRNYARDRFGIRLEGFSLSDAAQTEAVPAGVLPCVPQYMPRASSIWGSLDVEDYARETPGMEIYTARFRRAWWQHDPSQRGEGDA